MDFSFLLHLAVHTVKRQWFFVTAQPLCSSSLKKYVALTETWAYFFTWTCHLRRGLRCGDHEWHAELRRTLHWLGRVAHQGQARSKGNTFLALNHKLLKCFSFQNNTLKKKQDLSCCCSTKTMQPLHKTATSIHWVGQKISSLSFLFFFLLFFFSCMQLFHFNKPCTACAFQSTQLSPVCFLAWHFSALPPLPAAPCTQTNTFPRTAEWIGLLLTWASCYKHLQWDYWHLSCCWLKISRVARSDGSASCCDSGTLKKRSQQGFDSAFSKKLQKS